METDNSTVGNTNDVFFRDARDGHYFSYLMQTGGKTDLSLRLKYWGVGDWKNPAFDIFQKAIAVRRLRKNFWTHLVASRPIIHIRQERVNMRNAFIVVLN